MWSKIYAPNLHLSTRGFSGIKSVYKTMCESRSHFWFLLYSYWKNRYYKADGFPTFRAAYRTMVQQMNLPFKYYTLLKYFSLFKLLEEKNIPFHILQKIPLSTLIKNKQFIKQLDPANAEEFLVKKINNKWEGEQ